MSKAPVKARAISERLVKKMLEVSIKKDRKTMQHDTLPRFTTKKSITDFVYSEGVCIDYENYDELEKKHQLDPTVIVASRNTVNGVVNQLILEHVIEKVGKEYNIAAGYKAERSKFPVLDIAPKLPLTMLVPEHIIFLSTPPGAASLVAEYLNAQFYKGDIVSTPLGNLVMCINVLPTQALQPGHKRDPLSYQFFRYKIEVVMHDFIITYPQFSYGDKYILSYAAYHDPETLKTISEMSSAAAREKEGVASDKYEKKWKQFMETVALSQLAQEVDTYKDAMWPTYSDEFYAKLDEEDGFLQYIEDEEE